jgi:hypothetical protein
MKEVASDEHRLAQMNRIRTACWGLGLRTEGGTMRGWPRGGASAFAIGGFHPFPRVDLLRRDKEKTQERTARIWADLGWYGLIWFERKSRSLKKSDQIKANQTRSRVLWLGGGTATPREGTRPTRALSDPPPAWDGKECGRRGSEFDFPSLRPDGRGRAAASFSGWLFGR